MFGAIVAGRLVSAYSSISGQREELMDQTVRRTYNKYDTHFVFHLEQPYEINHLTVFLLGTLPFPEGYAASVHFAWPSSPYIPLGILTNQKPSAIFRLRPHLPAGLTPGSISTGPASLGIEIAPLSQIESLGIGSSGGQSKAVEVVQKVDVGRVAEKVVKNLFNYLHSFGGEVKLTPETPIPLSVFQRWYENFTRKIENDRGAAFLDRED